MCKGHCIGDFPVLAWHLRFKGAGICLFALWFQKFQSMVTWLQGRNGTVEWPGGGKVLSREGEGRNWGQEYTLPGHTPQWHTSNQVPAPNSTFKYKVTEGYTHWWEKHLGDLTSPSPTLTTWDFYRYTVSLCYLSQLYVNLWHDYQSALKQP